MSRAKTLIAFAATMLMTMSVCHAHPGHDGTSGDTATHYLSQPQHAATIGFVLLGIAGFATLKLSRARSASS
jgi:hypothetical protein